VLASCLVKGSTTVYLNDTYYQLAQRHPDVPLLTDKQMQVRAPSTHTHTYTQTNVRGEASGLEQA